MLNPNRLASLRRDNTGDPGSLTHVRVFLIDASFLPQITTQQCLARQTLANHSVADVQSSVLLALDLEGVPNPTLDLVFP